MAKDNKSLGKFNLDEIPPAPRGTPQIEVTFDIDASGILKVTALDKATKKSQNITISGAIGLSDDEVEKMKEEAEKHKEEDTKKAEQVQARNSADSMVVASEKAIKDAGKKLDEKVKKQVEEKIKAVKDTLGKEDASKEDLEKVTEELSKTLSTIGEAMYKEKPKKDGEKGKNKKDTKGPSKGKKDEKVEEGEVVE